MSFTDPMHNDTYPAIDSATKSDHSGKIVFITGASYGIGKATAISYAKAGAEGIILAARSDLSAVETAVQEAAKTAGKKAPRVLVLKMDVANEASVADGAAAVEKEFGRLDILINNAGYLSEFVPIGDSVPENWWRNFEVNIKGVYLVSRALLPLLLKGGDKTIVNLGSIGSHMTFGGGSGYQTTKFALLRMTEILQSDYDEQGILAYCVHPGGIMTELGHGLPDGLHPCECSLRYVCENGYSYADKK